MSDCDERDDLQARLAAAEARVGELENNISNEALKWHMKKLRETEERMLDEGDAFRTRVAELEQKLAAAETRFNLDCPTPDGCIGKQKAEAALAELESAWEITDKARADAEDKLAAAEVMIEEDDRDFQAALIRLVDQRDAALAKVRELEGIEGEVAKVEHNGVWARIATDRLHQIDEAMARVKELEGALRQAADSLSWALKEIYAGNGVPPPSKLKASAAVAHARQVLEDKQ